MKTEEINFKKYNRVLEDPLFIKKGKVINVVGLTIESAGPDARIGDICELLPDREACNGGGCRI